MAWSSPNRNELRRHAALTSVTLTSNLLKRAGVLENTLSTGMSVVAEKLGTARALQKHVH
jgi:hypothetical protein